ncbi:MAG: diacylglycerol kinase family protein [Candidatus Omnitrophica bacterium]|nr:diacylglycerol kinase family protein [Candidatus Omnitrophota bacterium]MBU1868916.1 diacylglycerol kinase family protein [Candidatus Omnitrophota bacterium]
MEQHHEAHHFKSRNFLHSLTIATRGVRHLLVTHRNMRVIFILGIIAFFLGLLFRLGALEMVSLCITITVVFMAEIFNTAIEMLMDIISLEHHTKIKLVKDIAAAVVIIACLNAVAVAFILFIRRVI